LFSIVVPAFETKEEFLREMIASVQRQSYPKWELIIADASDSDTVERVVREMTACAVKTERTSSAADRRIKYRHLKENLGISGNTNAGIALAEGDYIALLDHDDFITPDTLYRMARKISEAEADGVKPVLLYSDEDKYDEKEKRFVSPNIKEEFNFDLILSNNYICHFMAVETGLMKQLQLRSEYDGAQDYDLVLRVVDSLRRRGAKDWEQYILHIPNILYHWRCHADSTAENTASKDYAYDAGRRAVADFCTQQGWNVNVEHSLHLGFYDACYEPDILTVRQDVGIVGGRILDRYHRICGGAYTQEGKCLFEGLYWKYSGGATHRAVLKQDCAAVDVRCMQLQPQLRAAYTQITGLSYRERTIRVRTIHGTENLDIVDVSGLNCDEAGYRKLSMELGRVAENMKYRVLFNPQITMMGD
jgi:glycosyltransferase involved in cell wall biosynthesis